MIQNNNIELNIRQKNGVGITYGIDAKLDELFKQDIKLNASAWNSIMEIVKNDNATTEKQYSGGDTDINNGKHFIVTQNTYQITKKAWDAIVAKVSNLLNLTPPSEEGGQAQITEEPETPENAVKSLIGETAFDNLNDNFKTEVLKKYSTITDYAQNNNIEISDAEMARRLNNYITALKAHEQELRMGEYQLNLLSTEENEGQAGLDNCPEIILDEGIKTGKAGSDKEYYQAFLDRGEGYVQLYDTNGDGVVTQEEFLSLEEQDGGAVEETEESKEAFKLIAGDDEKITLEEYLSNLKSQLGRDLKEDEISRNTNEFNIIAGTDNEMTYEEYMSSEKAIAENYFNIIAGDKEITAEEMGTHLAAVSRLYDGDEKTTGEDITFKEWYGAQLVGIDDNVTNTYNTWREKFVGYFDKHLK
ncbi:EF-hand domain-containing protein [bacterium]|nr:EF-hand domain-containing protein [bacterium]